MAKSFDELVAKPPTLDPVAVDIEGLKESILIHQFSWDEFAQLMVVPEGDEQQALHVRNQVVRLLRGPGSSEPSEQDRKQLGLVFTAKQVREIYRKGLELNGLGMEADRTAQKK